MLRFIVLLAVYSCSTLMLLAQQPMVWVQRTDVGTPGFYEGAAMAFDAPENFSNSKTPGGPFQMIVFAPRMASR